MVSQDIRNAVSELGIGAVLVEDAGLVGLIDKPD